MSTVSRKLTQLSRQYDEKIKAQNWQGALETAEILLKMTPQQSLYYTYRGYVFYKLGDIDRAEEDFGKAMTLAPNHPQIPQWWLMKIAQERAAKISPDQNREDTAHYIVLYPYKWVKLQPNQVLRIGRDWENDLIIPANDVSRFHAAIDWNGHAHVLKDLGSTNQTSVNGGYIKEHILINGDNIAIGNTTLNYILADDSRVLDLKWSQNRKKETHKLLASVQYIQSSTDKVLSGDLSCISIWQVLQILATDRKTGCLVLTSQEQGKIYFEEGDMVHCEVGSQGGEEACYAILSWQQGYFEFDSKARCSQRTIDCSVEYLMFKGARKLDEQQQGLLEDELENDEE